MAMDSPVVEKARWIYLPLGLCALIAVGAHAAADVVGGQVLWCVDRVSAAMDAVFSRWSVTASLVEMIGPSQRTFFARAVALTWELLADALIAIPLLGYEEREAKQEWRLAQVLARKKPVRAVRAVATGVIGVAGSCSMARMVQGSMQLASHSSVLAHLCAVATLLGVLILFLPRAVFRALETGQRALILGDALLAPMVLAALFASPLFSFFR